MLLDTHVLLWLLDDSPRLGRRAAEAIAAAPAALVSSVSHVELRIKQMIGKVRLPDDFVAAVRDQGLQGLPFTEAHADALARFETLARHDPFDRMLLAQAVVEGVPFATADQRLLELGLPWVVDATR